MSIYDGTYTGFPIYTCELSVFFSLSLSLVVKPVKHHIKFALLRSHTFPFVEMFLTVDSICSSFFAVVFLFFFLQKISQPLRQREKERMKKRENATNKKKIGKGIFLVESVKESIKTEINCSTCWFYGVWVGLPLAFQKFAIYKNNWKINENALFDIYSLITSTHTRIRHSHWIRFV